MINFLIMFAAALLLSSMGFKKYVWFISIGYGTAVAAIGAAILAVFWGSLTYGTAAAKIGIWVSAALLYACETSPVLFRLENGGGTDTLLLVGLTISVIGLIVESAADLQKNAGKKKNPGRFVDTGLFKIVRCPNYFGEMLFWTGVFVGSVNVISGVGQWIAVLSGYLGIIYVMFGGARRLEMRQDRTYGSDKEYQKYVKSTPIMIPLIPLYSVKRYKWLVA